MIDNKLSPPKHERTPLTTSIRLVLCGLGALPLLSFASDLEQSQSLNKLAEHYHAKPSVDARCYGEWVQPSRQGNLAQELGHDAPQKDTYYAQADYGYWDNKDYAELSGNAILEQNGQQVVAEKIVFHPSTGEAYAQGQILFSDDSQTKQTDSKNLGVGIIGVAERLEYKSGGQQAAAQDVAFASTGIGIHGHAKQLQKQDDSHYQMQGVMFSTCPPTERKWHLDADNIDLNTDTGRGIARNSTLKIGNVPVFYLPYFNFPIDDRRSSGFLLPTAGINDGLEVSTPYYLNLHPQYDDTITPTVFSNRNPMITGEFRYLTDNFGSGIATGSFLPSDRKYDDKDRSRFFFDHNWGSKNIPHLSAYATYRYVSDKDYLNDFDTLGLESNPLNLPRRIAASYYNDYITADLRAETFQTLDGTNNDGTPIMDKDKPYSRLPQLSVHYSLPNSLLPESLQKHTQNFKLTGINNSAYFKKSIKDGSETEKSGGRIYNQISASYSWLKPWGYVTPKVSLSHLYASYDEDSLAGQNLNKEEGTYSVFAPTVSLDTGLFFEKLGSPFGWYDDSLGGYQVISPRLKYTYTPYRDQSKIPNFDTDISDISYQQLLSDSWFLGYDRIQDLHAVTPAVNYRYMDKSGTTRFDMSLAEQILLSDTKVGINDSQAFTGRSTGMAWQASLQPKQNFWIDAAGATTTNYDLNSLVAQLRYQPNEQSLFNVGIIERKDHPATAQRALSAYTASAVFPINNRWRLLSQAQYDYKNDRLLDSLLGINYEDCSYGISVYARRYHNDLTPNAGANNAIMAEIRLNGLNSGGKLNRLMNDKVMGYDHAQNAWQRNY